MGWGQGAREGAVQLRRSRPPAEMTFQQGPGEGGAPHLTAPDLVLQSLAGL